MLEIFRSQVAAKNNGYKDHLPNTNIYFLELQIYIYKDHLPECAFNSFAKERNRRCRGPSSQAKVTQLLQVIKKVKSYQIRLSKNGRYN